MPTIEERVIEIVRGQLGRHKDPVRLSDELENTLGADSLDVMEIVMDCEKEFDVVMPDDERPEPVTVQTIVDQVWKQGGR